MRKPCLSPPPAVYLYTNAHYRAIQLGWLFIRTYKAARDKSDPASTNEQSQARIWNLRIWLILHAVAMIYSFIMLLGAGISFPFR